MNTTTATWRPWRPRGTSFAWLPIAAGLVACDDHASGPTVARVASGAPLPMMWSELEAQLDHTVAYAPRFPLWTDGLVKTRTVTTPDGSEPDPDHIAVGTIFTKTLSDASGRPLESRVLVRREGDWELAAYLWDGDEAELLDGKQATPVADSDHVVPSQRQCRTCHESAPSPLLGFNDVQLGRASLVPDVADSALVPAKRAALGWVLGNCTHCHNGGSGPASVFDLRPAVFDANTLCTETTGSMSAPGIRITPGSPDDSILFLAASHDDGGIGVAAMPPLGVHAPDPAGVAALRAYISSLSPDTCDEGESRAQALDTRL